MSFCSVSDMPRRACMYVHCSLKYGQSFGGGDGASDANDCVLLNGRVMQMIVCSISFVFGNTCLIID